MTKQPDMPVGTVFFSGRHEGAESPSGPRSPPVFPTLDFLTVPDALAAGRLIAVVQQSGCVFDITLALRLFSALLKRRGNQQNPNPPEGSNILCAP